MELLRGAANVARIIGRLSIMATWLAAALIGFFCWKALRRPNPWPKLFLSGVAGLAGVRSHVCGTPAPGRLMLLANHVSWIDIPALARITGTAFVAHDGLARVSLLKWLCAMNGTVFIARHDRASIGGQIETLRAALLDPGTITLFPEGTTSDGTALGPFKSALLAALEPLPSDITIQPVWLDYGVQAAGIAWLGAEPGLANFMRILARAAPIDLTIHLLAPLSTAALTNRKTIAGAAHQAIVQAMALQKARALP